MQWDRMRSNEMRKIPKLKGDDGTGMKRREIVAAEQRIEKSWPHPIDLYAHSFVRSIGYRRFKFETSAPGLPRHYLYGGSCKNDPRHESWQMTHWSHWVFRQSPCVTPLMLVVK